MTVDRLEQLPLLYQGRDFPQTVVHLVKPGHRTPAMGLCDPDPPCLLQIGMDFFPALPDNIEKRVEATYNLNLWEKR